MSSLSNATTQQLFDELKARMGEWPEDLRAARAVLRGAIEATEEMATSRPKVLKALNTRHEEQSEDLFHDEGTLMKVRHAFWEVLGNTVRERQITDIISEMQNTGLLFRERRES